MIRTNFPPHGRRAAVYATALLLFLMAAVLAWMPAAAADEHAGAPDAPLTGEAAVAELKASGQYAGLQAAYMAAVPAFSQQAYLKADNGEAGDALGDAVAVDGDTAVVGAVSQRNATGAAYVFIRSGATWTQQAYLKADNAEGLDNFGNSVAISGDTIVVGAPLEDSAANTINGDGGDNSASDSGAAYVFVRNGATWTQQAYLKADNAEVGDYFGIEVAISGDTIVVGAPYEASAANTVNGDGSDNSAPGAGAAYVFVHSGATWSQQAYLKADNAGAGDFFGGSVAISGDMVVVGAPYEASAANSVNGDGSDNSAFGAGAAYVFIHSGAAWTQQAYLKADNAEVGDDFGYAVAISNDTTVVGAPYENSAATMINGDGSDNSAYSAGAAYVFAPTVVQHPLQVSVSGSGSVSSSPAGIDCGTTCTAAFVAGTPVTLTATADVTATFAGWSGACTGTGTCAVTMDAARQVTATFAVQSNPLTATLTSQFAGQFITYTMIVTNTGTAPQQVTMTGNLPADSDLVDSNGSFQPGGDFGAGFVTLGVPALGPGASTSLFWAVRMRDLVGDIVSSAAVSNGTLNLQIDAANKIYRVFLMKLFKDGSLTQ